MSNILVFLRKQVIEEWVVEEMDADGDGGNAQACFRGPFAEKRARDYAFRLNGETEAEDDEAERFRAAHSG